MARSANGPSPARSRTGPARVRLLGPGAARGHRRQLVGGYVRLRARSRAWRLDARRRRRGIHSTGRRVRSRAAARDPGPRPADRRRRRRGGPATRHRLGPAEPRGAGTGLNRHAITATTTGHSAEAVGDRPSPTGPLRVGPARPCAVADAVRRWRCGGRPADAGTTVTPAATVAAGAATALVTSLGALWMLGATGLGRRTCWARRLPRRTHRGLSKPRRSSTHRADAPLPRLPSSAPPPPRFRTTARSTPSPARSGATRTGDG